MHTVYAALFVMYKYLYNCSWARANFFLLQGQWIHLIWSWRLTTYYLKKKVEPESLPLTAMQWLNYCSCCCCCCSGSNGIQCGFKKCTSCWWSMKWYACVHICIHIHTNPKFQKQWHLSNMLQTIILCNICICYWSNLSLST